MNYFDPNSKTVVNIVKGHLRKVGHYTTYSIDPNKKVLQGWYWHNSNSEKHWALDWENTYRLQGIKPELYDIMWDLHNELDEEFFEFILEKTGSSLWAWQQDDELRTKIAQNIPQEQTYVIFNADDFGRVSDGAPIGKASIMTTGDDNADKNAAIAKHIGTKLGVGFYHAEVVDQRYLDKREERMAELEAELTAWWNMA